MCVLSGWFVCVCVWVLVGVCVCFSVCVCEMCERFRRLESAWRGVDELGEMWSANVHKPGRRFEIQHMHKCSACSAVVFSPHTHPKYC